MTLPVFAPPVNPDAAGSGWSYKPNVRTTTLGDNYDLNYGDGLNYIQMQLSLAWGTLTAAEQQAIEGFFYEMGAVDHFTYALPPSTNALIFRCTQWSTEAKDGQNYSMSATFKQESDAT